MISDDISPSSLPPAMVELAILRALASDFISDLTSDFISDLASDFISDLASDLISDLASDIGATMLELAIGKDELATGKDELAANPHDVSFSLRPTQIPPRLA